MPGMASSSNEDFQLENEEETLLFLLHSPSQSSLMVDRGVWERACGSGSCGSYMDPPAQREQQQDAGEIRANA